MIFKSKRKDTHDLIIGPKSGLIGAVTIRGVAHIDGSIAGPLTADWVIVGERGIIRGDVHSRGTVSNGTILGNVHSPEIVNLQHNGYIRGDVYTGKFVISEGAVFEGRSYMQHAPAEQPDKDDPANPGTFIVGSTAKVKATIGTQNLISHSDIQGDITATEYVALKDTAVHTGNITTPNVVIESGSVFDGSCVMNKG